MPALEPLKSSTNNYTYKYAIMWYMVITCVSSNYTEETKFNLVLVPD